MSKMLAERQVLKKLKIPDFRHLNKEKMIPFVSLVPRMDPETVKKALEQFPDFASVSLNVLQEYKGILEQASRDNAENTKACNDAYYRVMDSLQEKLEKDDLSFEEKKYFCEQLKIVADAINAKDTENKQFLFATIALAGGLSLAAIKVLGSILGADTQTPIDSH